MSETTCTELKRWTIDANWAIVKTRDEADGEIGYEVHFDGKFDDAYDTLAGARLWIRQQKNQTLLDEVNDLLSDVDLENAATAGKLAAMIRFLKK